MSETTTTEPAATWRLDAQDIAAARDKIAKINARAGRNGLTGRYSLTLGATIREPIYDDAGARLVINGIPHTLDKGRPVPCPLLYFRELREVQVHGAPPRLGGWAFLATLTWEDGVLVTRCVPGFDGTIDRAALAPGACDHCHKARQRRDCYLVENAETGERVQVGATCIKDFLGHRFTPGMLTTSEDLDEISERLAGGHYTCTAPALDVLAHAAAIVRQHGWINQERAEIEYRPSSSQNLRAAMFPRRAEDDELRRLYAPAAEDFETAAKVLAWAQTIEPGTGNEYLANLLAIATATPDEFDGAVWVSERNTGILGSAVPSYARELDLIAARQARKASEWIGEPKDRITVAVTLTGESIWEDGYGVHHRYAFTTTDGNRLTWKTSGQGSALRKDAAYELTGTVKCHEEYREVKSTVLLRCKYTPAQ